ncbi:unnamed protein product, partial [Amoebophrya sp. A25]|eukprot:GSA25T00017359001.1
MSTFSESRTSAASSSFAESADSSIQEDLHGHEDYHFEDYHFEGHEREQAEEEHNLCRFVLGEGRHLHLADEDSDSISLEDEEEAFFRNEKETQEKDDEEKMGCCEPFWATMLILTFVGSIVLGTMLMHFQWHSLTNIVPGWSVIAFWSTLGSFGGIYLFYLLYSCCASTTKSYMSNVMPRSKFEYYVNQIRHAKPRITFSIQNYHYETRTRTTTQTDSNGKTTTRTETYTVRVDTHYAEMDYEIGAFIDHTWTLAEKMRRRKHTLQLLERVRREQRRAEREAAEMERERVERVVRREEDEEEQRQLEAAQAAQQLEAAQAQQGPVVEGVLARQGQD